MDAVRHLKNYVTPLLDRENFAGLVINLKKVDFIDSSGVGALFSIHKTLQSQEHQMAVCHLNKKTQEILMMTRLDRLIHVYKDEETAIVSFNT